MAGRVSTPVQDVAALLARELGTDVCSVYAMRSGDLLELVATVGLRADAIGQTRLRVGEGIIGNAAARGSVINLADAQAHPDFALRAETGEQPFASLLAVPLRRAGRVIGVLTMQNRAPRCIPDDQVELVEIVAMLLAEMLAATGTRETSHQSFGGALPRKFTGNGLAPGIVVGTIVVSGPGAAPRTVLSENPEHEFARITAAAAIMRRGLDALIDTGLPAPITPNPITPDTPLNQQDAPREILEATRLLAADSGWLRRVREAIEGGLTAEAAVHRVAGDLRDRVRRLTDPYLREKLAYVEDLAQRLLTALDGDVDPAPLPPGAILAARRLGPAQLLAWHKRGVAGFAIEEASSAGHAAILARALGLPALGGMRGLIDAIEPGDEVVLDADEGGLILRPEVEVLQTYQRAIEARALRQAGYAALRSRPARTQDGARLHLMLNVGLGLELDQLDQTGADGIGLFRTEIAMLAQGGIADVPEQTAMYTRVLDAAGDRPVHFRTLDLGGDKLLPGSPPAEEENPAMGWRSLRIGLDRPALLRRQLRALLIAAAGRDLHVMFPMVATVAEFRAARQLFWTEAARIRPSPRSVKIGAMLEVPSLLWQLPMLLSEVDFLSVGTNDLMQFLFAADRGTPKLAARYDILSAPVFDLLDMVRRQADRAGKPVSVCGEAASRQLEAMALVAMGFDTLSVPATLLLPLKSLMAQVDLREFRSVLATTRQGARGEASLREPLLAWTREHGLPIGRV